MGPQKLAPSEIVAALVFLTQQRLLLSDPHRLHRALLVAQEVCPLLSRFGFSTTGVNPMSRAFDEALGILKLSRIVRMENTDYKRYIIDEDARHYIETEILPKFTPEEQESLARAANIVREQCGTPQAVQTGR